MAHLRLHCWSCSRPSPPKVVRDDILKPLVARYGAKFAGLTGWQFSTLTADHRYWNDKLVGALRQ